MPPKKRVKTDYKGVYFIEVNRIDKPGTEKMFYYYFRDENGRQREEKAGRQYGPERMGAKKASLLRADRMRGVKKSRKEIRQEEEARRFAEDSRPTFKKLWQEYSKTLDRSLAADRSRFEQHLKDIHDKTPDELVSLDIDRIKRRMKKNNFAPQTIKHCLTLIERIVNYGVKQKPRRCDPLTFDIEKPKFDNQVKDYLTADDLQSLLAAIDADLERDPWTGRAMLLAMTTGVRIGGLKRLKWSDIDYTREIIYLRQAKSGKENKTHTIPLNDATRKVLNDIPKTSNPYVFPGQKEGKPRVDFKRGTKRIRKAAGMENIRPFHDLRHAFASALMEGGVGIFTTSKLLNHADIKTTQRYAHISDQRLKEGSATINSLIEQKKSNITEINRKQ